jgi:D-alanyl-D-alanine carboxypeptidase/D-alanyl-D-alanine-endopeptidase (penicillin-binding protein 4)
MTDAAHSGSGAQGARAGHFRVGTGRAIALAALVLATAGVSAAPAGADPDDPAVAALAATIDAALGDGRLTAAQAAVVVRDLTTGETLYSRNGDRRLIPASNTKLLTSTAALGILGSDYRFTTDVRGDGNRYGSLLKGNLYLRGTGDPTMLAADYDALAAGVAASGVKTVVGDLVADDTWFDNVRLGTQWSWDDEPYYYSAQISALSVAPDTDYDAGTVIVAAAPGATAGAKPVVTVTPETGYVQIVNQGSTIAAGGADTLTIEREHGTNRIFITGTVPVGGATTSEWATVWEPTGYAADVFRRALARHGVTVLGRTRLGTATPAAAKPLASRQSMTLAELMVPFMKLSNNGHAEVLTKAIGRQVANQGTWSAGLAAIRTYLAAHGMDTAAQRQSDGSGLTRWNLVPATEFVDLLAAVRAEPWFDRWYAALPIAGDPARFVGGTLRSRMRNTPAANNVHAKTGTLTSVSGLSGYVTDADGHVLAFSILLNNHFGGVKDIEDRIAVALASFSRTAAVARAVVPPPTAVPEIDLECSWVKPAVC